MSALRQAKRRSAPGGARLRAALFFAAFILGAVFLLIGISRGEVAVVLKKAIYICLECIGIG
ncbi:MAG: thioredoxin [Eubacteriales bacterium]|nr:thioredoxin [Eubacteriales bacterium]